MAILRQLLASKGCRPVLQASVQSARRSLRHFVTYGRTNKYIPVKNIKASAATAKRPIQLVYLCLNTATPLKMTTSVKAMDSQRCTCRTHLLQSNGTSSQGSMSEVAILRQQSDSGSLTPLRRYVTLSSLKSQVQAQNTERRHITCHSPNVNGDPQPGTPERRTSQL